jgi:serine/threonine protein kinase
LSLASSSGEGTALQPGQLFGTRYRVIHELSRGGMGVVYQARDDELGIAVALKVIRTEQNGPACHAAPVIDPPAPSC